MRDASLPLALHKPPHALLLRLGMWRGVLVITLFSILASVVVTSLLMLAVQVPDRAWPNIFLGAIVVPLCVAGAVSVVLMRMLLELDATRRQLHQLAIRDGLTGIGNRMHFRALADAAFGDASRHGHALSVLMVDADDFKKINDAHGHASGDEVLRRIASAGKACVRAQDLLARYGGEEFVVLMPHAGATDAREIAERFRAAIEALHLRDTEGAALRVTVSVGIATRTPQTPSLDALLNEADQALYRAKAGGRNRVEHAAAASPPG